MNNAEPFDDTEENMFQYFDGLVQDCSNSSALAMELLQWSTEPSICAMKARSSSNTAILIIISTVLIVN